MAARTGRKGTLSAARLVGSTLAAVLLSVGALALSTLSSVSPASAKGSPGQTIGITTTHVANIGTVLATKSGLTLYTFTVDPAGKATCTGACAKVWPPLLLPKGVTRIKAPHGVKGLSVVRLPSGRLQVFFHHKALYRFVSDKKKGQATGQNVAHEWSAALSDGKSSALLPVTSMTTGGIAATTPTSTGKAPAMATTPGTSTMTASPPTTTTTTPANKPSPTLAPTPTPAPTPAPTTTTTAPPPTTTTTAPSTGGVAF